MTNDTVISPGPLTGVTVLDLSAYIAGPYGCALLADFGAEVIKVEPPTGDTLRHYPSTLAEESRAFIGTNRSKRAIALDLKKTEGLAILTQLIAKTDVVVHNFRPSVPKRLGIDYESVKKHKPDIIYCALTGYGETGPMKDRAGYDQVLQSVTGMCTFQGEGKDGPEIVYGSVVDFYSASLLAYSVSAALFHRERTGQGQSIGVSALWQRAGDAGDALRLGGQRAARHQPAICVRAGVTGIHPTRKGEIYISANTPHFWQSLCELAQTRRSRERPTLRHGAHACRECRGDRSQAPCSADDADRVRVGSRLRRARAQCGRPPDPGYVRLPAGPCGTDGLHGGASRRRPL